MRYGRFTSSKIGALQTVGVRDMTEDEISAHRVNNPKSKKKTIIDGFGISALEYIREKGMERRLGRCLDAENSARPLQWGKCVEGVAFEQLGTQYEIISEKTIVHPLYDFWSGSPDLIKHDNPRVVCDIKCPSTLKSFCTFVDSYLDGGIGAVRNAHKDGETYYWQLVSNAILTGCNKAELIVYMPYKSELHKIKDEATSWGYQWISFASDVELPYLIDGGVYKNINVLPFDIPQDDIDLLISNVVKADSMLAPLKLTIHDHNVTVHDSI